MVEVIILVEGQTEKDFVERILAPHLGEKSVFVYAPLVPKQGQKGGDVTFEHVARAIRDLLRQRPDTYLTFFVDFYGLRAWPGLDKAKTAPTTAQKSEILCKETRLRIRELYGELRSDERFIPYFSMHEFEALLFSNPAILASELDVQLADIESILKECHEPENINDSAETAPSKRIQQLKPNYRDKKRGMGIAIAQAIGLATMRHHCPLFDQWVHRLENLSVLEIEVPTPAITTSQQKY